MRLTTFPVFDAACNPGGGPGVNYVLTDLGTGNCTLFIFNGTTSTESNCRALAFGQQCGSTTASIQLVAINGAGTGAYVPANFGTWLNLMGLNGVNRIGGLLNIVIDHNGGTGVIPGPLSLNFLNNLQQIDGFLGISEIPRTGVTPFVPALVGLPGLARLFAVQTAISVTNTAFTNFRNSLTGLTCPPFQAITFSDNPNLTSTDGLERLSGSFLGATGPSTTITGNPRLAAITSLSVFGQCPTPSTAGTANIKVLQCPAAFANWAEACTFIASGACPPVL
jgi:hypothetical protein